MKQETIGISLVLGLFPWRPKVLFLTINHEKNGVTVDTRKQQQHSIHVTFPCKNRCPKKNTPCHAPHSKIAVSIGVWFIFKNTLSRSCKFPWIVGNILLEKAILMIFMFIDMPFFTKVWGLNFLADIQSSWQPILIRKEHYHMVFFVLLWQALAKQFAEILDFTLTFDDLKVILGITVPPWCRLLRERNWEFMYSWHYMYKILKINHHPADKYKEFQP